MKAARFILAAAWLGGLAVRADLPTHLPDAPAAAPAPPPVLEPASTSVPATDNAASGESGKIADFERRFAQGKALEDAGQLSAARQIFEGILAEAPDAKGSLREAGLISVQLGELTKANDYFDRLHALVPDYPMAIEALIQVNQTLKRDAKVEILIKQLTALAAAGKTKEPYFVRERIHFGAGSEIVITQFFDYRQPRYYAWAADLFDATHNVQRRLTVNYDPEVTQSMRAKDPRLAHAEEFLLVDNVMAADGRITRLDVYQQFVARPDYGRVRAILLGVFANALKPIDSAPVPASP